MKFSFSKDFPHRGAVLLAKFPKVRLLVAGDLVVDETLVGVTERISREAPVLILRYSHTTQAPGGAGNALANAAALGGKAVPLGVVGEDEAGKQLLRAFRAMGLDTSGVVSAKGRRTPVKTRVLAGGAHTAKQQVIRIDRIEEKDVSRGVEERLVARLTALAPECDALLVSDYDLGTLTEKVRRALLSAFEGKPVVVDSRHRLQAWKGATLVTPNVAEAAPAAGVEIRDEASLEKAGRILQEQLGGSVLITRGPQGMSLFDGKGVRHIPVFGIEQPVDPTGAGDTVAATTALSLSAGAEPVLAASLAAVAAGLVVAKRGTVAASKEEVLAALKGMASG